MQGVLSSLYSGGKKFNIRSDPQLIYDHYANIDIKSHLKSKMPQTLLGLAHLIDRIEEDFDIIDYERGDLSVFDENTRISLIYYVVNQYYSTPKSEIGAINKETSLKTADMEKYYMKYVEPVYENLQVLSERSADEIGNLKSNQDVRGARLESLNLKELRTRQSQTIKKIKNQLEVEKKALPREEKDRLKKLMRDNSSITNYITQSYNNMFKGLAGGFNHRNSPIDFLEITGCFSFRHFFHSKGCMDNFHLNPREQRELSSKFTPIEDLKKALSARNFSRALSFHLGNYEIYDLVVNTMRRRDKHWLQLLNYILSCYHAITDDERLWKKGLHILLYDELKLDAEQNEISYACKILANRLSTLHASPQIGENLFESSPKKIQHNLEALEENIKNICILLNALLENKIAVEELEFLELSSFKMTSELFKLLCILLEQGQIKHIGLNSCNLTSEQLAELQILLPATKIESISISDNFISNEPMIKFLNSLQSLSELRRLDISWNPITGTEILSSLKNLLRKTKLIHLNVSYCMLDNVILDELLLACSISSINTILFYKSIQSNSYTHPKCCCFGIQESVSAKGPSKNQYERGDEIHRLAMNIAYILQILDHIKHLRTYITKKKEKERDYILAQQKFEHQKKEEEARKELQLEEEKHKKAIELASAGAAKNLTMVNVGTDKGLKDINKTLKTDQIHLALMGKNFDKKNNDEDDEEEMENIEENPQIISTHLKK